MFVWQNVPLPAFELPGLTVRPLEVSTTTTHFDLTLILMDTAEGLQGAFEYNTDLFAAPTIGRMAGHFQSLLEGIVARPEQRLCDFPLLTDAERRQVLVGWNDTKSDYPRDVCIQQLFEARVELTPEAVAVVLDDEQVTYRELNRRANQVAHHLRTLGVGPEVLVGLCLERSAEMVVGLLGILKAGGAYVPLDPDLPTDRLAFYAQDSALPVLLTQRRLLERLPGHNARVVCRDDGGAIAG